MDTRLGQLQHKEIVDLRTGAVLGYADDIVLCVETAQVQSLVVCGRPRLFGLLGRQPDLLIPWGQIQTIGEDTVLVSLEHPPTPESAPPRLPWKKWKEFWR